MIDAVWLYVNAPGKQSKTISGMNKTIKVKMAYIDVPWPSSALLGSIINFWLRDGGRVEM